MLTSDRLIKALNEQVGHELGASVLYLSIAAYFDGEALSELAKFFYRQSDEEREHALKFIKYIVDVGGTVQVPEIGAANAGFDSAQDAVATALQSEEKVTRQIFGLVEIANEDKDYTATQFLDWFVAEQREEVALMGGLLQVVKRAGEDGMLMVEDVLARGGLEPSEPGEEA